MILNAPKPKISGKFTLDDIRAIRKWNYERLKKASAEERLADIRDRAASGMKQLAKGNAKRP
jgi:hypothetical protein